MTQNNILYCPIDIETPSINEEKIHNLFYSNCELHYTKCWNYYTICCENLSKNKDFQDYKKNWDNRYKFENTFEWDQKIEKYFPEIKNTILKLPFNKLTHINLLKQVNDVPPHIDYDKDETVFNNEFCYKWLLIPGKEKSFFIDDTQEKYITTPNKHNIFVIPETKIKHGAKNTNKNKIIISIFGELNIEKSNNLIKKSYEKFKEYTITR